jgi:hypothetical protein
VVLEIELVPAPEAQIAVDLDDPTAFIDVGRCRAAEGTHAAVRRLDAQA